MFLTGQDVFGTDRQNVGHKLSVLTGALDTRLDSCHDLLLHVDDKPNTYGQPTLCL